MSKIVVNPETLLALKSSFDTQSTALDQLTHALQGDVDNTHADWQGHVADDFRNDWVTTYAPTLRQLATALGLAGNDVQVALTNALAADHQV